MMQPLLHTADQCSDVSLNSVLKTALRYDPSFRTLLPLVGLKHISVLRSLIRYVERQQSDPHKNTGVGLLDCHMQRARRPEMYTKVLTENPNGTVTTSDLGVYGKIILKQTLMEKGVRVRPCFSLFRVGSNDGFLCTWHSTTLG